MDIRTFFRGASYDAFDNHPDAVIVTSNQRNVVFWNKRAEEILGFGKKEVAGRNIGIYFLEDSEKIFQNLNQLGGL